LGKDFLLVAKTSRRRRPSSNALFGYWDSAQGLKQPGSVAAYLPPSNAKISNKSFCTFIAYNNFMS